MASSPTATRDIAFHVPHVITIYKDGSVERFFTRPHVEPCLEDPTTGVSSKDIKISTHVSARLYQPKLKSPEAKLPVLVYYHSGGFCLESAFSEAHHSYLNTLASEANCLAVSVEYRLAPEHLLPAAFEDSWTALQWVASHAVQDVEESEGKDPWLIKYGDFGRVFVCGDSAGGNIAHNMAMKAGTEELHGGVKLFGAILAFPYFGGSELVGAEPVETKQMWEMAYPSAPGGADHPLFNPFVDGAPSLKGLPCSKLFVCTAGNDVLRGRALSYVESVKKSGWNGEIEFADVEGEGHCFQLYKQLFDVESDPEKAKELTTKIANFIMQ